MEISRVFANQMVQELNGIIHQHINFIDQQGMIIASTDPERINSYHMGAKCLIDKSLPYLIIDSDQEFVGSRKGVNLPIVVDEDIVGVIGITGERSKVAKYGEIIKKFTEMYIRDEMQRSAKAQEEKIRSRFLEQWLKDEKFAKDPNFSDLGHSVGVDVNIPRRVLISAIVVREEHNMKAMQQHLDQATRYLKKQFQTSMHDFVIRLGSRRVFFVQSINDEKLEERCRSAAAAIKEQYGLIVQIGYDEKTVSAKEMHQSYLQARKALSACALYGEKTWMGYRDIHIELFLHELSDHMKLEFIEKVFANCSQHEIMEYRPLLELLYENNGSIEKTAAQLFIHKNTLQYKLKGIEQKTGYDPRHCKYIPLFDLALKFFSSLGKE